MAKGKVEDDTPKIVSPQVEPETTVMSDPVVRRLRMNRAYRGARTNEQVVLPNQVYYEDDPALFGLAEFFVENAYAEWVQ